MSLKIIVIGVGNASSAVLNSMYSRELKGVEYFLANTDADVLNSSPISKKILLGPKLTKGLALIKYFSRYSLMCLF